MMYEIISSADFLVIGVIVFVIFMFVLITFMASRYRRCPSNKILVVYGKVGGGKSARCIHGGGTFIWPLIQDYRFIHLTPMTINIPLKGALSLQNIRINVPSTFTFAIDTSEANMNNAAVRLLDLTQENIESMAAEIIFGQTVLVVSRLTAIRRKENMNRCRFQAGSIGYGLIETGMDGWLLICWIQV